MYHQHAAFALAAAGHTIVHAYGMDGVGPDFRPIAEDAGQVPPSPAEPTMQDAVDALNTAGV